MAKTMVSWQAFPPLPPSSHASRVSLAPKTPFPFPFKRLPRRLGPSTLPPHLLPVLLTNISPKLRLLLVIVICKKMLLGHMWLLLIQHSGLRGRQEHRGMRLEDFRIMKGNDGLEFVEFAEGSTKTRPGGLSAKSRQFQPKMFQTRKGKCPVALFRQYISCRPPNLRTSTTNGPTTKFGTRYSPWEKIKSTP